MIALHILRVQLRRLAGVSFRGRYDGKCQWAAAVLGEAGTVALALFGL